MRVPTPKKFARMAQVEPRLNELLAQAIALRAAARGRPNVCANRLWVDHIKPQMNRIVGWNARDKWLKTSEAWDCAFERIYAELPNCRNCPCIGNIVAEPTEAALHLADALGGPYLHFIKNGRANIQGLIVDYDEDVVRVALFDALTGGISENRWYARDELIGCRFYPTAEIWRAAMALDWAS